MALRERGRRAATAELLEDGRPSVTLASGGRATPAPGADVGGLAVFAGSLDPRAEIVIAGEGGAPDARTLELRASGARDGPLASVAVTRFGRDYGPEAASEAARLAALVERRLLRPAGGARRWGLLARAWGAVRLGKT